MSKQERKMPVSSNNMTRMSPYPLRSTRKDNQIIHVSPIETEGPTQWKDVQCVICMDPPHNVVLLHCSSFHNGFRAYICDTSARHSNCLKKFLRNHKHGRLSNKSPKCPLCRGEVYETMRLFAARRFMNKKPRLCSIEDCKFSGTHSQLNIHVKNKHHDFVPPKVDSPTQLMRELEEREVEFIQSLIAGGFVPMPEAVRNRPPLSHHHAMIERRNDAQNLVSGWQDRTTRHSREHF